MGRGALSSSRWRLPVIVYNSVIRAEAFAWRLSHAPKSRAEPRDLSVKVSGSNSVVECDLAKVEVAGSNPVSRSRNSLVS